MFYVLRAFFVKSEPSESVCVVAEEAEESAELSLICVLIISKLVIQLSNNLHNNYNKPLAALSLAW